MSQAVVSTGTRMPHTGIHRVSCTNNRCMKILPSAQSKKSQKIVIGDQSGTLMCFKYKLKENNIDIMFHETKQEGITALTLYKDDIFYAYGQNIEGIKKKGKKFFEFKQTLNEDVTSMRAQISSDNNNNHNEIVTLWCCGEFVYNCYVNKSDKHFYMSNDIINDILIIDLGLSQLCAAIACKDKCVRILHSSNLLFEAETDDSVTCLHEIIINNTSDNNNQLNNDNQQNSEKNVQIVFGLENGSIGQLFVSSDNAIGGWVLEDKNEGRVNCLSSYDFTNDEYPELIVGRDNGHLDVYQWNPNGKPFILANEQINESITSVDTGYITAITNQDIIISTYSGKIIAFHCDPDQHFLAWEADEFNEALRFGNNSGNNNNSNITSIHPSLMKMKKSEYVSMKQNLINEINDIKRDFEHKKLKYQEKSRELIAVTTQFQLKHSLKLLDSEACYLLTLEIGIPVEFVAIKSTIGILSLDVDSSYGIKTQHKTVNVAEHTNNNNDYNSNSDEFANNILTENGSTPLSILLNNSHTFANNCFVFHSEGAIEVNSNTNNTNNNKNYKNNSKSNSNTTSADININPTGNIKSERITRFTWKFRVLEGSQGEMICYIASNRIPKTCQSIKLPIQSLSLHSSIFEIPDEILNCKDKSLSRPWNILTMNGDWTVRAFNNWITKCIPEVPTRVDQTLLNSENNNNNNNINGNNNNGNNNGITYNWISTFLQSYLTVTFNKGSAIFKSDNVSCIAILQEYLTKYAIENNITLYNVQVTCQDSSAMHFLNLIRNNLEQLKKIFDQYSLMSALKEIESHETAANNNNNNENNGTSGVNGNKINEITCLKDEYKYILNNYEKIEKEFKISPKQLDFVKTTIWFAIQHYCKLRNINLNQNQTNELMKAIDSCEYQNIAQQLKTFMR